MKYTLPEYWKFFEEVGREAEGREGGRRAWERNVWGEKVLEAAAGVGDGKGDLAAVACKKRALRKDEEVEVVDQEETSKEGGRPKRSKKSV